MPEHVVNLFRKFDSDQDNILSIKDVFIGMRMMDVSIILKPLNGVILVL